MDINSSENSHIGCERLTVGSWQNRSSGAAYWLTVVVFGWCALYALIFLYHGGRQVLYPFDVDNSEAYLVYQGVRISEGHFLYPKLEEPPYLVDNYPPLYPALIGAGFTFMAPNFHWPRAISLVSTCLTALLLAFWTLRLTRNKPAALLTALVYLSFYHVNNWGALARVDALGVVLAIAALLVFEKKRSWKMALPLIILSLVTRQTLFAAPLAIYAALLTTQNRKSAHIYFGALLGSGLVIGVILLLVTSGRAWSHLVIYNANTFRLRDVYYYFNQWLSLYTVWGCAPLLIFLTQYPGSNREGNRTSPLLFWFTLFAIGEALLCGKIGSAPNYLLSLAAASSVGVGLIYSYLDEVKEYAGNNDCVAKRNIPLMIFLCACVLQLGSTWHWPNSARSFGYTPTTKDALIGKRLMKDLEKVEGPVLSDRAGIALVAGHLPVFQPFILTQLAQEGRWDQTALLNRIENQEFNKVLLHFDLSDPRWDRERFTPEMIDVLQKSYALEQSIGAKYFIYRPE